MSPIEQIQKTTDDFILERYDRMVQSGKTTSQAIEMLILIYHLERDYAVTLICNKRLKEHRNDD